MEPANTNKEPILPKLEEFIWKYTDTNHKDASLSAVTLVQKDDPEIEKANQLLSSNELPLEQSRAFGCFICSAIGDALGCYTEFSDYAPQIKGLQPKNPAYDLPITNFNDIETMEKTKPSPYRRAEIGQWTDDTSMALCVADSMLQKEGKFDGIDLRYRFSLWWNCGYNTGRQTTVSFGLGGNIAQSFRDFYKSKGTLPMTKKDCKNQDNGNGSIMRLAPVPIFFHKEISKAMEYAESQSYTTHNGEEAAECCRLLASLIVRLINRKDPDHKKVFDDELASFKTRINSVQCLASSKPEKFDPNIHQLKFNADDRDRNWDWRSKEFKASPYRLKLNSGYYGSYCMDAMALSLHLAYHSSSAQEAIMRAVNAGGDSDTVAAITGQIVGAIYGLEEEIVQMYKEWVWKWDGGAIITAAWKLFNMGIENEGKVEVVNKEFGKNEKDETKNNEEKAKKGKAKDPKNKKKTKDQINENKEEKPQPEEKKVESKELEEKKEESQKQAVQEAEI